MKARNEVLDAIVIVAVLRRNKSGPPDSSRRVSGTLLLSHTGVIVADPDAMKASLHLPRR